MDNLTHSLAGMLLADAVCTWRRETRAHVRTAASLVSALANNLPDSDIVYSWLDGPKPLGSLLHHRGHTHTLLVALPMAWLLGLAAWRVFQRKHAGAGEAERRLLFGLALLGPVVHLLMDFGNNYGVHPFWPLYSRWLYGDAIFIVEPLWIAVLVPSLAAAVTRRWLAVTLWVVLVALLLVCWFVPFVPTAARLMLLSTTALAWYVARTTSDRARSTFALGACVSIAAVFAVASGRAKAEVRAAAVAAFPALTLHDIATAPLPANPACWEALLVGEQGGVYRVVRASVALPPFENVRCVAGADVDPSAPVTPVSRVNQHGVRWLNEYRATIAQLSQLRRDDCRFRALLRFARVPYVTATASLAGDLRYDRQAGLDFSDLELRPPASAAPCPRFVPGWQEPRSELFQP